MKIAKLKALLEAYRVRPLQRGTYTGPKDPSAEVMAALPAVIARMERAEELLREARKALVGSLRSQAEAGDAIDAFMAKEDE